MKPNAWSWTAATAIILALVGACVPFPTPAPPLTAAAAQQTLEQWNPNYCKVAEFYGLHHPGSSDTRLAYALVSNPQEQAAKPAVYEARFQLLIRPDGKKQWFLTSLITHSAGLSRPRQGWDNLMVPVKEGGAKPTS